MSDMTMDTSTSSSHHGGMSGMPMSSGTGLSTTLHGYSLSAVQSAAMGGMTMPITFTITKDGQAVTEFDTEQTKLMHFYLIRSDLTGFQHLHPTMAADGTWTATPAELQAGSYRVYVQFVPHADASHGALALSRPVSVNGPDATTSVAVPAPESSTTVDGYTVRVAGQSMAGEEVPLSITLTRDGKPVTDLQPYLGTYAHVTAIHSGDLAFAHLHPSESVHGGHGGPSLIVNADLPEGGTYRMFIQFQTVGTLHTAALTITAS